MTLGAFLAASTAFAQEGSLDVLDGETLYECGWLFTVGYAFENRSSAVLDRDLVDHTFTLAACSTPGQDVLAQPGDFAFIQVTLKG